MKIVKSPTFAGKQKNSSRLPEKFSIGLVSSFSYGHSRLLDLVYRIIGVRSMTESINIILRRAS